MLSVSCNWIAVPGVRSVDGGCPWRRRCNPASAPDAGRGRGGDSRSAWAGRRRACARLEPAARTHSRERSDAAAHSLTFSGSPNAPPVPLHHPAAYARSPAYRSKKLLAAADAAQRLRGATGHGRLVLSCLDLAPAGQVMQRMPERAESHSDDQNWAPATGAMIGSRRRRRAAGSATCRKSRPGRIRRIADMLRRSVPSGFRSSRKRSGRPGTAAKITGNPTASKTCIPDRQMQTLLGKLM